MKPCVYILAGCRNGTIYVGVTSELAQRISQHKSGEADGFTKKYTVHNLVWYQYFETMSDAIAWEKKLKKRRREWKIKLIEEQNPYWNDLSAELTGE